MKIFDVFIVGLILIILCIFIYIGGIDKNESTRILEEHGYKNIKIEGYDWFNCDRNYMFHTKFEAQDKLGNKIDGCVCSGSIFKETIITIK